MTTGSPDLDLALWNIAWEFPHNEDCECPPGETPPCIDHLTYLEFVAGKLRENGFLNEDRFTA